MSYDHNNPSRFTLADADAAVGKRATVTLTGTIVKSCQSEAGPYVKFLIDERWGFGRHELGMDLDAFEVAA